MCDICYPGLPSGTRYGNTTTITIPADGHVHLVDISVTPAPDPEDAQP